MKKERLPAGFIVLSQYAPQLKMDLKYCGSDNLIGRPLRGYAPDGSALLTQDAAQSLVHIHQALQDKAVKHTLDMNEPCLVIFEAYRPQRASEDFWEWSQSSCEKTKPDYYPNINKKDFFKLGYIARKSSHSRGSTVDLNIMDAVNGRFLDMGTRFDFMDPLSHPDNQTVKPAIYKNRQFLKQLMAEFGWQGIPTEWWHFTFEKEPYSETYFDFPVLNYTK